MTRATATITNVASGQVISAQFNPAEIKRTKGVDWAEIRIPGLDFPKLHFIAGNARQIPLRLEFDGEGQADVSETVRQLEALVQIDRTTGAPPTVRFVWGPQAFDAVVSDLTVTYDAFREDGTPTACTVEMTLCEYDDVKASVQSSSRPALEPSQYVVREGDTLSSIAYAAYGDPAKWRDIAKANGIANPRSVAPGTRLVLPPREQVNGA